MTADQKTGPARGGNPVQGVEQAHLPLAVQALRQLVDSHELGRGDKRTRQQGPLGLPRGYGAHGPIQDQPQAHFKAQGPCLFTFSVRWGSV